jgi:hypothetical protein
MNNIFKFRIAGMFIALAMLAVFGVGVMFLWNALLPGIFGLSIINYWQSAGLLLLSRILFGGLGGFGRGLFMPHGGYSRDERLFRHGNPLREKWMNMTDEERKAFAQKEKDFLRFHRGFSRFHDFFEEGAPSGEGGKESGRQDAPSKKEENHE